MLKKMNNISIWVIACISIVSTTLFIEKVQGQDVSQKPLEVPIVQLRGDIKEYIFTYSDIQYLEDSTGTLNFNDIKTQPYQHQFVACKAKYPKNTRPGSVYWYRIRVNYSAPANASFLLEFYDQTIEDIQAYLPDRSGQYRRYQAGAKYNFSNRLFSHKNFEFLLEHAGQGSYTYYFRLRSSQEVNVIIVHRSLQRYVSYALTEYFSFGLFYGMIVIFSFYNVLMYVVMRKREYLYYVLYILAVGLYEMCTDGIAFQYLWPNSPRWNEYAFGIPLFLVSSFALLFTSELLRVKKRAPQLYQLIIGVLIIRTIFFLLCFFYNKAWFGYKFIEFLPLSIAFYTGVYSWIKGFNPARFFVLGYAFVFLGFILKVLVAMGYGRALPGPIAHYSISFCFILEMLFLSFAIGDRVRYLKKKKELAQQRTIVQMTENAQLKDSMNRDLEIKVEERTREIVARTNEVHDKSLIIEQQNEELLSANTLLKEQSEEIERMNLLLQEDNQQLQTNIKKVTRDRLMSAEVNFAEFSKTYPDRESCFGLLAELKWKEGYICRKCGNTHHCAGHLPYSRRCTKCGYDESVITNTILQNTRIPVNKAFYIIFLIYTTKGKISSYKISGLVDIRQSTCWMYSNKIKKVMEEREKEMRKAGAEGWTKLIPE